MLIRAQFSNHTLIEPTDSIAEAPLVGFDTETDGLYIERGARIREFAVVDRGGLRLGWRGADAASPELTPTLLARLLEHLAGKIVVGHNLAFDLRFLVAEVDRAGLYCPSIYCIDTLALSRKYLAEELTQFKLVQVANHLRIEVPGTLHRAEPDARLSLTIFETLCERFGLKILADAEMRRFAL